jgi:uncharacterized protein
MTNLEDKAKKLADALSEVSSALVAFSGGTDSTFLLKMCMENVPGRVVATTAISPIHGEAGHATGIAQQMGAELVRLNVPVMEDPAFRMNPPDRCYICKHTIFQGMLDLAKREDLGTVMEGSIVDDLSEFRPGRRALAELGIISPLIEAGFTKADVRKLSSKMGLVTANLPSGTCMATRFPYGFKLTEEWLARVERAEEFVRGFVDGQVRVRARGYLASIEVGKLWIATLMEPETMRKINDGLTGMGFVNVLVDPEGYRSGSMDEDLSKEDLSAALSGGGDP